MGLDRYRYIAAGLALVALGLLGWALAATFSGSGKTAATPAAAKLRSLYASASLSIDPVLIDEAEGYLKLTTIGYVAWLRNVENGKYDPLDGSQTNWGKALALLELAKTPPATTTTTTTTTTTVPTTVPTTTAPTTTTTPTGSVIFNGDFETGNLSQFNGTYCYFVYSCTVGAAPGGRSGSAARFEIRSGESSPIGSAHAQIQANSSEKIGNESWWRWDVYLPSDFVDSNSFWQVITEWHHYALGGGACGCTNSPPLTFQEKAGRFFVTAVNSNQEAQGQYWTAFDLGVAVRGAWTRFDMHAKWSDDPAVAVTDVYVNGALKQHITGHPNEYTGFFNYFLAGWYRAVDPQTQAIYLDDVRRCSALCP